MNFTTLSGQLRRDPPPHPVVQLAGQVSRRTGIVPVSTRVKRDKLQARRSDYTAGEEEKVGEEEVGEEEMEETTRSQTASGGKTSYRNASGAPQSIYIHF